VKDSLLDSQNEFIEEKHKTKKENGRFVALKEEGERIV
jgi:hypothetical protein